MCNSSSSSSSGSSNDSNSTSNTGGNLFLSAGDNLLAAQRLAPPILEGTLPQLERSLARAVALRRALLTAPPAVLAHAAIFLRSRALPSTARFPHDFPPAVRAFTAEPPVLSRVLAPQGRLAGRPHRRRRRRRAAERAAMSDDAQRRQLRSGAAAVLSRRNGSRAARAVAVTLRARGAALRRAGCRGPDECH